MDKDILICAKKLVKEREKSSQIFIFAQFLRSRPNFFFSPTLNWLIKNWFSKNVNERLALCSTKETSLTRIYAKVCCETRIECFKEKKERKIFFADQKICIHKTWLMVVKVFLFLSIWVFAQFSHLFFSLLFFSHRRNACSCPAQSHFKDERSSCSPVRSFDNNVYCSAAHIQHPQHVTELTMCNKAQLSTYI